MSDSDELQNAFDAWIQAHDALCEAEAAWSRAISDFAAGRGPDPQPLRDALDAAQARSDALLDKAIIELNRRGRDERP